MTFTPKDRDDLYCRGCDAVLTLQEYRRFGLCTDCEVRWEFERLPDVVPATWKRAA